MKDENLGKEARDRITRFKGIITCKCEYLYGCAQYGLNPSVDEKGNTRDIEWFDVGRVEVIGKGVAQEDVMSDESGCENQPHP